MIFSQHRSHVDTWLSPVDSMPSKEGGYDLLIYCVGYETRSSYVSERLKHVAHRHVAFSYDSRTVLSFDANLRRSVELKHLIFSAYSEVSQSIEKCLSLFNEEPFLPSLALDISAMDRTLMAEIYLACLQNGALWTRLDILYAPAEFRDPRSSFLPIASDMAIIPELAGRLRNPHVTSTMVVGLGFEYGVAQGLIERFEPNKLIVFRPLGNDPRFSEAVKSSNFDFAFDIRDLTIVDYELQRPYELFYALYDIARGLASFSEFLIAPGGPKIFSMLSIVIGFMLAPDVCVWRVSLQGHGASGDAMPSGDIYAVRVNTRQTQKLERPQLLERA